jgi:hypothetical protein
LKNSGERVVWLSAAMWGDQVLRFEDPLHSANGRAYPQSGEVYDEDCSARQQLPEV